MPFSRAIVLYVVLSGSALGLAQAGGRTLPKPLAGHPGNVFLAGEEVVVTLPAATPNAWRAVDCEGKVVAKGEGGGPVHLGRLPVGYYEVRRGSAAAAAEDRISLGVLAPLAAHAKDLAHRHRRGHGLVLPGRQDAGRG